MPSNLTRRRALLTAAGAAALAATTYGSAHTAPRPAQTPRRPAPGFPEGFRWGTATSAYQVEGAAHEAGRGPSIWDTFTGEPGRIRDGSTGHVSVDHYHRYKEDVALMKSIGARTYRFSIAWPRIFPEGTGTANPRGLDFYDRLVDELLEAGIEPFATLYHWDLPQALQDRGGWESRDTAQAFGDYAAYVASRLTDRVRQVFTINEMQTFVEQGHETGNFAPGLKLPLGRLNQVRHHAVLAHGLAVQAVRASGRRGTKVGPAENIATALPAVETAENIKAAELATRELNAPYLTVMLEGRYTDAWLAKAGRDAPRFTDQELKIISSKVDFVGLNVYAPSQYVLASEAAPGFTPVPFPSSHPHMASSWLLLGPEALYWAPRHAARLWQVKDIFITENGASAADEISADGAVYDVDRVMYLRNCLMHLQRATAEAVPVRGYFLWSLLDNFEWADGYATRFGLVHVDYATQKRTPKLSAAFYREVISRNALA
ncbi:MAG: beta-glucosidase [Reyranella sp.]|uniref:GH1 family beta-glucosidase n=1 Tax=Reyranella sp. TaxID=1929291 RepID=UPI001215BAD9|nr:GH1 family beta-glucosidase [Reyranella sp.]TAJ92877.1 MAG: beta-glucosidase [Reyranella sp.]TBR30166.1 MAG: beta-glucosidase [Reyranella sp.]